MMALPEYGSHALLLETSSPAAHAAGRMEPSTPPRPGQFNIADRIEQLSALTPAQKKAEWHKVFGTPAPPAFSGALLIRAIAARWQEQQFGSLSKPELREIRDQIRRSQQPVKAKPVPKLKPGSWLSRTWHGEVHEVVVLDGEFEYRGKRYASLTAIAREITGAGWSGPRFFGLGSQRLGELKVARRG